MAEATVSLGTRSGRRIVLTTLGSLGDLHPYIALALGLKARGHEPTPATSEAYRRKVEPLGIGFRPIRPDDPDWAADPGLMARLMDARTGGEVVIREYVMPNLRQMFDDALAAVEGADLVVSLVITFATRLAAESRGIPWASSMLQPFGSFSAHDPPVLAPGPDPLFEGQHAPALVLALFSHLLGEKQPDWPS